VSASPRSRLTIPGLADARHVVLPEGIVASGYPAVKATCAQLRLGHDPWQAGTSTCIFAKDAVGDYAGDTVVISVARQVGKTYLIGSDVFADSIITPGSTTVWTAHRFKVARETFNFMRSVALSPALQPHIDPDDIHTAAGNESIGFKNGSRIVFAARERGSVRGIAKVRRLILDEGQILTETAMSDLAPTMNQAVNPQIILMGTPPKPGDPSEVLTQLRTEALDGTSEGVVYIEFSADTDCDLDDREAWHKANPSLGTRTPYKAIVRLRKLLSDEDFAREALGIWGTSGGAAVIDSTTWRKLSTSFAQADEIAYGIDVSPSRDKASIGMAGWTPEGRLLVEWVEGRNSADWVVEVAKAIHAKNAPRCFVIDRMSQAADFIQPLTEAGVPVVVTNAVDYGTACARFYDSAMSGLLLHLDQPPLNVALSQASKRDIGAEGLWGWNRKKATSDITPLVAVTLAIHGVSVDMKVKKPSKLYAF
jgi:phage terminase large subunit-like protein